MCGKFTQMFSWTELFQLYSIHNNGGAGSGLKATPMGGADIVTGIDERGKRPRTLMRWGWGDGRNETYPKHIHARAETIDTLKTFRDAFVSGQRGILFVDSFNEGEEVQTFYKDGENANNPWTRQWTFRRKDRQPFPIAVIFDVRNVGGMPRPCFVQVTTDSNGMVSRITGDPPIGRMPAILDPEDFEAWLGENEAPPAEAKACLKVFEFDTEWECFPEDPSKKPPTRKRPAGSPPPKAAGPEPDMFD